MEPIIDTCGIKRTVTKCPFANCSCAFNHKSKLERHISTYHSNARPFKCTFNNRCNKSYKREDHLKRHLLTHKNEKLFKCNYTNCNLKFNQNYHLRRHIKCVHGPPQYKCNYCNNKFQKKRKLNKHMALIHNEFCPFVCKECLKRFSRECDLNRHQHKKQHFVSSSKKVNIQLFICSKCDQIFEHKIEYKKHLTMEKKKLRKKPNRKRMDTVDIICGKLVSG
eukprot:73684_1